LQVSKAQSGAIKPQNDYYLRAVVSACTGRVYSSTIRNRAFSVAAIRVEHAVCRRLLPSLRRRLISNATENVTALATCRPNLYCYLRITLSESCLVVRLKCILVTTMYCFDLV